MATRRTSNRFDLDAAGTISRLKTGFLPDGPYFFEDELEIDGFLNAKVITGAAWLLELYNLSSGDFFCIKDDVEVRPRTSSFGVLYSAFTITHPSFRKARARLIGVASTVPLPHEFSKVPVVFDTTFHSIPANTGEVADILRSGKNYQSVESSRNASLLSRKAKQLIDANYLDYPSIARIAARLNVTHAHLSRQFKLDFGLSPNTYLHKLRLADTPLRLARGEPIVKVSFDAGYNDLSRFYKQFRKNTRTSPGVCQKLLNQTSDNK
ncbi:MAG TPA: AraC family transcriptional regulator [Pyrinomonadaceae bacterium]|nr:AraC family transcriptional regulator [Pyrinomonadaceae bacterium]